MKKTNVVKTWLSVRSGARTPLEVSCHYNSNKRIQIGNFIVTSRELGQMIAEELQERLPDIIRKYDKDNPGRFGRVL